MFRVYTYVIYFSLSNAYRNSKVLLIFLLQMFSRNVSIIKFFSSYLLHNFILKTFEFKSVMFSVVI